MTKLGIIRYVCGTETGIRRNISFSEHASLTLDYGIRRQGEGQLQGSGSVFGTLELPLLTGVLPVKTLYRRISPGRLVAASAIRYITESGAILMGSAESFYEYDEQVESEEFQLRISSIQGRCINDYQLQLDWSMTVEDLASIDALRSRSAALE